MNTEIAFRFRKTNRLFALTLILAVFLAVAVYGLWPKKTQAQLRPFGGQIISMLPCLHPFRGWYIVLGPPVGGSLIYQFGTSFSYPHGPPVRPGQWLLGMAAPDFLSCSTRRSDGEWRRWRSGGLIIFHGSSL